jgi:hypothetical protein
MELRVSFVKLRVTIQFNNYTKIREEARRFTKIISKSKEIRLPFPFRDTAGCPGSAQLNQFIFKRFQVLFSDFFQLR